MTEGPKEKPPASSGEPGPADDQAPEAVAGPGAPTVTEDAGAPATSPGDMPAPSPPQPAPKASRRWRPLAVAGALLVAGAVAFLALTSPQAPVPYEAPGEAAFTQANGDLWMTLRAAGYDDVVADVNETRALVAYELPPGPSDDAAYRVNAQRFALSVAAAAAPPGGWASAIQHIDGVPRLAWRIGEPDYRAFLAGTLTAEEFEARILKTAG